MLGDSANLLYRLRPKYRKTVIFDLREGETPDSIATRLKVNNYVGNLTSYSNMGAIDLRGWSGRMREISL